MAIKVILPQLGESVLEGTVTKWLKQVGEKVKRDEALFEVSTDKVDTEIVAPADGILSQILVPEGQVAGIFTVVGIIEAEAETPSVSAPSDAPEPSAATIDTPAVAALPLIEKPEEAPAAPASFVRASPLVRRIAREHGIDLSRITGTGLSGRITRTDIQNYLAGPEEASAAVAVELAPAIPPEAVAIPEAEVVREEAPGMPAPAPTPAMPRVEAAETGPVSENVEIVTMTPMRKAIAERMILSRRTSAHVQTVFEIDMTPLVQLRDKHGAEFEKRNGIKLTYTPFVVKALVDTVRDFPILNSSVSGDRILFKKEINVGIAVALETGLIVPVVRDAQQKPLTALALAIHDLAARARNKKLKPDEVLNGTITVTNPGIFGSLFGTPIINQPQVAILCVGTFEKRPVIINDAIAIRTMAYLALSFDHRVIDGAVADQAMSGLKSRLQSWDHWAE
jgi:pyruvate dehydrogenase E2 component (dihydrolipoamide acetyltransferase)